MNTSQLIECAEFRADFQRRDCILFSWDSGKSLVNCHPENFELVCIYEDTKDWLREFLTNPFTPESLDKKLQEIRNDTMRIVRFKICQEIDNGQLVRYLKAIRGICD